MTFTIAASPLGSRVGISSAHRGDQQVLITVSPKAWRPTGPRQLRMSGSGWSDHVQVSLYETERLQVHDDSPAVSSLLWDVLGASRREVGGVPSWDSSLLTPDIPFRGGVPTETLPHRDLATETANLLRLFERVELLQANSEDLVGRTTSSPLHRPLLYRRLLDEVRSQVETARPGYRNVVDLRSTIRGRVDARSILAWEAGVASRLRCRYSELTISTPLLGCICAALEWIADGRGGRSRLPGEYSDVRLRHDAVTLRRVLADVVALPPKDALMIGRSMRLGRLDRSWSECLEMSTQVLRQREVLAGPAGKTFTQAVELSVPTDKLWERIVNEALVRAGFESVVSQARDLTSDPWVQLPHAYSRTAPDNVARRRQEVFIVDAKYKVRPAGKAPSRDDQYQMFAYSHLVRDMPREVKAAVLVYPGNSPRVEWIRGRDEGSSEPVRLFVVQIPFPTPVQVSTPRAWTRFIRDAGLRLGTELGIVRRAVEELIA